MFKITACVSSALVMLSGAAGAASFGYFGENGPAFWGALDPAWETCGSGENQSPVDFRRGGKLHRRLSIDYGDTTGAIVNNGHSIEIETEGPNTLAYDGLVYKLVQFHFHAGSEHRQLDRGYDMELHLVHRGASGTLAVIGVFLKRGTSSGALAPIFEHMPQPGEIDVGKDLPESFDPADFLPKSLEHHRYLGSLTTPPCTEGVHWFVLTEPVTVSDEHIAQFAERIHFNARSVQRNLGR